MDILIGIVVGYLVIGLVISAWGFALSAPWQFGMPAKELLWRYPVGVVLWPVILLTIITGGG